MKYLIAVLVLACGPVKAADKLGYMVSGILQKPGTTVVTLVQSIQVAYSAEQAKDQFVQLWKANAPDRVMIETLVNPVVLPPKPVDCGVSI